MSDLTEVKITLARVEERITAVDSKIDKLASQETAEDHERRIEGLERNHSSIFYGVLGTAALAIANALGLGKFFGAS